MNDGVVILERETANDETASVVVIHVRSGTAVEKDDLIFDIENSKATQELRAPRAGILSHELEVGQTVAFGVPIARILPPGTAVTPPSEDPLPERKDAERQASALALADVMLERETANDETGTVVAIHVASGHPVDEGQCIVEVETSKATQELTAPRSGLLTHDLIIGQTVAFGLSIAKIMPRGPLAASSPPTRPGTTEPARDAGEPRRTPPDAPPQPGERPLVLAPVSIDVAGSRPRAAGEAFNHSAPPRFSKAAAALMAELSGSPSSFATGFVTAEDVRARFAKSPPRPDASPRPVLAHGPGEAVNRRKRAEIDTLKAGAGDTLLSVLGVTIGPLTLVRTSDAFLNGRITDLVIYEAARLMRKYPKLNAFYDDGSVVRHGAVHAGLALDDGGRLVVYGIEHADRASLGDISAMIAEAVSRYVANELTARDLSRATFTVSDLSAAELDFILPLLPRGQSCILGITHSQPGGFRIFAGFDHRVTEGREVSLFLGELKDRLLSFAERPSSGPALAHCAYCEKSVTEAVSRSKDKGLLKIVDHRGREALCCASCWNGW